MNWEAIGAVGEIVGALAVVASLLYLAIQIRHSRKESQAASRDSMARMTTDILLRVSENPDLASIFRRGQESIESLTDDEALRFTTLLYSIFESWETTFSQWQRGRLTNDDWSKWEIIIGQYMSQPGTRFFWESFYTRFDKSFAEYVNSVEPLENEVWVNPKSGH